MWCNTLSNIARCPLRYIAHNFSDTTAYPNAAALADGDYRAGHAHVSSTDGTETRQATKYGIQGANVEVLDTFWVLSSTGLDSKVTTHGAEVYINYLLMYMGCYDHKDKALYGGVQ